MSDELTDGRRRRVSDGIHMIFMGRTIERLYGTDALQALVDHQRRKQRESWKKRAEECGRRDPGYLLCLFGSDAHDYEVVRNDGQRLEVVVTRCVHADTFRKYNAADLGELLICSGDEAVVEGYNPDMEFRRPCTCMTGDRCHFIFSLENTSLPGAASPGAPQ